MAWGERARGPMGVFDAWQQVETLRRRTIRPGQPLWMANVNYRIGAGLVMLLRSTRVSANLVTVAGMVVHVVGAVYVATLQAPVSLPSALLVFVTWQMAFSLDCADGSLARERGEASDFGFWLDRVSDFVSHFVVVTALSIFLVRALDVAVVGAVLLTACLLGANLLLLFSSVLKLAVLGPAPDVAAHETRQVRMVFLGKQVTDYAVFLAVSSLCLLAPPALLAFLLASAALSALSVLTRVVLNWTRQARTLRLDHRQQPANPIK